VRHLAPEPEPAPSPPDRGQQALLQIVVDKAHLEGHQATFKGRKRNFFGVAQFNMRYAAAVENGRVAVRLERVSRLHRHPNHTGT